MKRTVKLLILAAALAALALLFALNVSAMPARPGSGKTGEAAQCRSHAAKLVTLDDIPAAAGAPAGKGAPALTPATKNIPLVVIVVGYSNLPYENGFDWAAEIFEGEKSLQAYYSDMSFGKFTFTPAAEWSAGGSSGNTNVYDTANDGVIHVSLSVPHKDWSTITASSLQYAAAQKAMVEMFKSAVQAASAYMDYSAFDANGDGAVTNNELAIAFVAAGYEGSYTEDYPHGKANYLWSHAWSVTTANEDLGASMALPVVDGVTVDDYIAIAEKLDDGSQAPIGLLAHELGHYLGLPDLYDTAYNGGAEWSGYDAGVLSIMCAGGWGIDPANPNGFIPYSMDAWCRSILGWYKPQMAAGEADYNVVSQSYNAKDVYAALIIPTQHVGEYYLLENRQNVKWDAGLQQEYGAAPLSNGLIIWHIDDNVYDLYNDLNSVNNTDHRPTVMPLFPEGSAGSYQFVGTARPVYTGNVFFDAAVWGQRYANLGTALDLPIYGEGTKADKRASRSLSGITVKFLTNSTAWMKVHVNLQSHNHRLSKVAEKPATCTEAGRAAYWTCNVCGVLYADAAGTREVTMEQLATQPLGHTAPNVNGRCSRCGEKLVSDDEGEGPCPLCGENHDGSVFGKLIRFFHGILAFFKNLFNR